MLPADGISSAAYGTEEILIELVQFFGFAAAFALLIPMTGVVLFGIAIVVLLYREVVSIYTRAGGSYVVARDNFGPRIAQVAAVALLIDYVVTVAVQVAAGSAAIVSTIPTCPIGAEGAAHRDLRGRDSPHVLRQPARHPRGRPDVRAPDVPVLRHRRR